MIPLAHVKQNSDGSWAEQTVEAHLNAVGQLAYEFAKPFGAEKWARIAGVLHDLGKIDPSWQSYLMRSSGCTAGQKFVLDGDENQRPNHSESGAIVAFEGICSNVSSMKVASICGLALAYAIAGHHAGLADWRGDGDSALLERLKRAMERQKTRPLEKFIGEDDTRILFNKKMLHCPDDLPVSFLGLDDNNEYIKESEHFHLWVRMLFSCLVDADFLDTEAFMQPGNAKQRGGYAALNEIGKAFGSYMTDLQKNAPFKTVNKLRREVFDDCLSSAELEPGFFSLTVPTGGGKTFASFAFALKHALKWHKRRIIIAIPYTSIIEQTADALKTALGDELAESVLEHHTNLDPQKETQRTRLTSENWDAPVVVTTNVQLLESLLGSTPSRCRKLHNIAGSVIVLDEAQMLPLEHYRPALSVLKTLVKHFGVTIVLCTATQPALNRDFGEGENKFDGLPDAREIVRDVPRIFSALKRVERQDRYDLRVPIGWGKLAEDLVAEPRALAVVNTRRACRELYNELKKLRHENLFHLSAAMCPEHRSERIAQIKALLDPKNVSDILVVSTQLIEAGVDLDFPAVYRAMCGLDSAVQAAGRCNREGKMDTFGRLYLFTPENSSPPGLLRKGEETLRSMLLNDPKLDIFDRKAIRRYFENYYAIAGNFDKADFYTLLLKNALKFEFQFRTFDENFRVVDNADSIPVFVAYKRGKELIEQLCSQNADRGLLRCLQRYTVTVGKKYAEKLLERGLIAQTSEEGFYYQTLPELYNDEYGIDLDFAEGSAAGVYFSV